MRTHTLCALAATAALLALAACGGSNTANKPVDPPPQMTEAQKALLQAVKDAAGMVDTSDLTDAEKIKTAKKKNAALDTAIMAAEAGKVSEADLKAHKDTLTAAQAAVARQEQMNATLKADRMKAEAQAVHAGIAPYSGASSSDQRRYAQFNDQGNSDVNWVTPDLGVDIGLVSTVKLKPDATAEVGKLKGWTGSKWKLTDEGTTYEAWVYDNRYSDPNTEKFNAAWTLQSDGALNHSDTSNGDRKKINSVTTAGSHRIGKFGEVLTDIRGEHSGVPGTYSCAPAIGYACAVEFQFDNYTLGGATANNNILSGTNYATWRFTPDDPDQRVAADADNAFVTYGYWIKKSADGKWDVSAFHNNHRGEAKTISGLNSDAKLVGTATYNGGAAGVYALSAEAGTFTADAQLVADFSSNSALVDGVLSVTGTIDKFMTKGFTGGDSMPRDWSVELQKLQISSGGSFVADASNDAHGRTRWTMDGTSAPAAGKWEGNFYERGGNGQRPRTATGSFYADTMNGKMVGAFGVTDPGTDEPLVE